MATKAQVRKIHVLKDILSIDKNHYRAMLSGYTDSEGMPVWSSMDLSIVDASSLIDVLERRIDETPELRKQVYASFRQLGFIRYLWGQVSRATNEDGLRTTLNSFLLRRFRMRRFDHIPRSTVSKIITSLRCMRERKVVENER